MDDITQQKVIDEPDKTTEEEDEEEDFEIEKIIDDRIFGGRKQYLVKWKNYSDSDNTWQDADSIQAPDLLKEYLSSKNREGEEKNDENKDVEAEKGKQENESDIDQNINSLLEEGNDNPKDEDFVPSGSHSETDYKLPKKTSPTRIISRMEYQKLYDFGSYSPIPDDDEDTNLNNDNDEEGNDENQGDDSNESSGDDDSDNNYTGNSYQTKSKKKKQKKKIEKKAFSIVGCRVSGNSTFFKIKRSDGAVKKMSKNYIIEKYPTLVMKFIKALL